MKMLNVIVRGRMLTLLFVLAMCVLAAALVFPEWSGTLIVSSMVLILFIAWRVLHFRARLVHLLRQMVTGDFEVGLPGAAGRGDEVSAVGGLVNRLAELMRNYDELRTRRIRQLRMILQLVVEHAEEPMMLYDAAKETLECNSAAQGLPERGPLQTVSLAELRGIEPSKAFADMLLWVVKQEKSPWQGNVELQFPGQDKARRLGVHIVPFKDRDETVPVAVVFGIAQKEG